MDQWIVATCSVLIFVALAIGYAVGKIERLSIESGDVEPTENRIGDVL